MRNVGEFLLVFGIIFGAAIVFAVIRYKHDKNK